MYPSDHGHPPAPSKEGLSRGLSARAGWLVPLLLLGYACYFTVMDYEGVTISWLSFGVAVSLMLCVSAASYRLVSFVTAVCVYMMFHYAVGPVLNLMLDEPRIRPDLWGTTHLAQGACIAGSLAMAAGIRLCGMFSPWGDSPVQDREARLVPGPVAVSLTLLYVPVFAMLVLSGVYDWRFVSFGALKESIAAYSPYINQVFNLSNIACAGIFLQLFRYVHTRSRTDLVVLVLLALVPVVLFAPTGTRAWAVGHLPWLFLVYAALEPRWKRTTGVLVLIVACVLFLNAAVGAYRTRSDHRADSFVGQWEQIMDCGSYDEEDLPDQGSQWGLDHMARRLNEYVACGRIIAWTPGVIPFRGSERISDLLIMWIPRFIFPERRAIGQSAEISTRYGVARRSIRGSAPVTLMGDLYSRWGWMGIGMGMLTLGAALALVDNLLLRTFSTRTLILYGAFVSRAFPLPASDLIGAAAVLTRELLTAALMAWLLALVIDSLLCGTAMVHAAPVDHLRRRTTGDVDTATCRESLIPSPANR